MRFVSIALRLMYRAFGSQIRIRSHDSFKGFVAPDSNSEARVSQYADDTTIMVMDVRSIDVALELFELFGRASGAVVILDKCNILPVAGFDCDGVPADIKRVDVIKINGVFFEPSSEAANVAALKAKVDGAIRAQSGRSLTIFGKALIVNMVILSKLCYVGAVGITTLLSPTTLPLLSQTSRKFLLIYYTRFRKKVY